MKKAGNVSKYFKARVMFEKENHLYFILEA